MEHRRAIDLRYLERWDQRRRQPPLTQMGVDETYRGKKDKFLTVVSKLQTGEPLWFGKNRKKETLDEFFRTQLKGGQRKRIEAACVDMWEPFRLSIEQWAPRCRIVNAKFHIIQHANDAVDEVRRAEFFRKGRVRAGMVASQAAGRVARERYYVIGSYRRRVLRARLTASAALPTMPAGCSQHISDT